MGQRSRIEWTDSTWNPVTGCTQVSAGCDNCYALSLANRRLRDIYLRKPTVAGGPADSDPFAVRLWPERLLDPLSWRSPRMVRSEERRVGKECRATRRWAAEKQ